MIAVSEPIEGELLELKGYPPSIVVFALTAFAASFLGAALAVLLFA